MRSITVYAAALCAIGIFFPTVAGDSFSAASSLQGSPVEALNLADLAQAKIHHRPQGFLNPFNLSPHPHGNPWEMIKWKLGSRNLFRPFYADEKVTPVMVDWQKVKDHRGLSITFIKHATVLIRDMDAYLLVDPIFFGLPGPITDHTPLGFRMEDMPRPDFILITHAHYDHLDKRSLQPFAAEAHFIAPLGQRAILDDIQPVHLTELDWFESFSDGQREIILLPSNHWSMRNPFKGPNGSLWGSYLVRTATGPTIYIAGDSAYFDQFKEIGNAFPIDLVIFNLGAYEPRWFMARSHMNPAEVVQAFRDLRARRLMIVHWGTFRLGEEPVHFPPQDMRRELEKAGLLDRLIPLVHGETLLLGDHGLNAWAAEATTVGP